MGNKYPGTDELASKWSGFSEGGGVTLGTLFHIAMEHGWTYADMNWLNAQADTGRKETKQSELKRRVGELAKLPPLEYEQVRDKAAKGLGISRVSVLDAEVKKARGETTDKGGQGKAATFDDPEPWPDPVDPGELLDEIRDTLRRYLVLPDHTAEALALWSVFTWTIDAFDAAPLLLLTSPEKRCGKTRTLDVLQRVTHRPLPASNSSPAALFRSIEANTPTLLIDEADTFLNSNDELRGVINSGFTRTSAFILRTVGDDHEPRQFSTWSPKAIAMIRTPADTIIDRAVVVQLKRKAKGERVERLRDRMKFPELRRRLARFTVDYMDELREAEPDSPDKLDDRAADKWSPMFALADLAGGQWPGLARSAALALSAAADDESLRVELLRDIRGIFENKGNPDAVTTDDILAGLHEIEERPWNEYGRAGKPISSVQLARLLKPFEVKPRNVSITGNRAKGYPRERFTDAWKRYL
jgi:putative DNA primase/helicase